MWLPDLSDTSPLILTQPHVFEIQSLNYTYLLKAHTYTASLVLSHFPSPQTFYYLLLFLFLNLYFGQTLVSRAHQNCYKIYFSSTRKPLPAVLHFPLGQMQPPPISGPPIRALRKSLPLSNFVSAIRVTVTAARAKCPTAPSWVSSDSELKCRAQKS